jgi:aminoglycoside 6'-N-acetyltransferase I
MWEVAVLIERLSLKNRDEVQELFLSVFSKPPWNDKWDTEKQLPMYLEDLMDNKNSLSFGYYEQGKLIGLCLGYVFHWWQGTDYFIKEFCIESSVQGKGHGKAFISAIEAHIKSNGIKALYLTTERLTPAYTFYQKNGFHELKDNVFFAKSVE